MLVLGASFFGEDLFIWALLQKLVYLYTHARMHTQTLTALNPANCLKILSLQKFCQFPSCTGAAQPQVAGAELCVAVARRGDAADRSQT